ncbi:regulatory protein [Paucibacter oligotrophus]|uniref:Regulatory protein RecX n=1 Tax=Roseateles oligotrophus TaxID=1769250 RepID=A0A840L910_9BURK|nr:regulatory protein RecX [Roseateles oligotrophus]MBB4842619.1 regulatory protein [Roseateles oligotrophus]
MKSSKPLSLKARAIALLAQREHSVSELRRKLLRMEQERLRKDEAATKEFGSGLASDEQDNPERSAETVEALLAWLQAQSYLSEARFVESRLHARAARFGAGRIKQELAQHGLSLDAEHLERLKNSELDRARGVWERKFGAIGPPSAGKTPNQSHEALAAARAKQTRFLLQRGFAPELIRQLLRALEQEEAEGKDAAQE